MAKNKKFFLAIYEEAIKTRQLPHPGLCATINRAVHKEYKFFLAAPKRAVRLFDCFSLVQPTYEDCNELRRPFTAYYDRLAMQHFGEDRPSKFKNGVYSLKSGHYLTDRRATLLLLMAALNNEL